jgi:hypothetical protein
MKRFDKPIDLIIEKRPVAVASKAFTDIEKKLKDAGIEISDMKESPPVMMMTKGKGLGTKPVGKEKVQIKTAVSDMEINPWDMAHLSIKALGKTAAYVEPDFWDEFVTGQKVENKFDQLSSKSFGARSKGDDYDPDWQPLQNLIWHLDDNHSQLMSARNAVRNENYLIRIGHLDTGYSNHGVIPDHIKKNPLQRNFIEGESADKAFDIHSEGFLKQPGHGTGTLGLLAGGKVNLKTTNGVFNDYLGGAWFADVVCCRISKSVVLFKISAVAEALRYLTQLTLSGTPVHVVSMSMGGAPSRAWADAVNDAYMAGITLVTAAGNNFNGLPTRHVIYPARFERVIAACGVTYDFAPYYTKLIAEMQGNYGPSRHMDRALAAFTPNTPWASMGSGTVNFSGAGTSSATPQIAAAAAIYYRKYHQQLDALKPWQRVEAIRNALYSSALKKVKSGFDRYDKYFGNGILQANAALSIPVASNLPMTPEDSVPWFPILDTIFKAVPNAEQRARLDMFNTELAQLVFSHPELAANIDNNERDYEKIGKKKWSSFVKAVIEHPDTSVTLRKFLKEKYKK